MDEMSKTQGSRRDWKAPTELVDHDGIICAVRIDGPRDTRGKAAAFFAREYGVGFTEVRVRRAAFREDVEGNAERIADGDEEPYDGWPLIECGPGEDGHAYWVLREPEPEF